MNTSLKLLTCLILTLALPLTAASQEQRLFDNLSVRDGMPHSEVNSIVTDKDGFIWFGTLNGLTRYDGYDLKTYVRDNSHNSLSNVRILSLCTDGDLLYIGTEGGGLNIMDLTTHSFSHHINFSNLIYSVKKGLGGNIWAGAERGVYLLKDIGNNPSFTAYGQSISHVTDVCETEPGILLAASDTGFYRIDTRSDTSELIAAGYFRSICPMGDNSYLVGGVTGLHHYVPDGSFTTIHSMDITCISRISNGEVWVGTISDGLYRFDATLNLTAKYQHGDAATSKGLSNNGIRSMHEDFSGNLWIGTLNGLNKLSAGASQFDLYNTILDGRNPKTATFFEDESHRLWIGAQFSGVRILDRESSRMRIIEAPKLKNATVSAFFRDPNGSLWIGTWDNLYILKPGYTRDIDSGRRLEIVNMGERFNMTGFTIFKIVEDKDGELWLSTNNGIYRYLPSPDDYYHGRMLNYTNRSLGEDMLTDNTITDILVDQDSAGATKIVWAGSHRGLNKILVNGEGIRNIRVYGGSGEKGMKGDFVSVIHEDHRGNLWIVGIEGYINKVTGNRRNDAFPEFVSLDINAEGTFDTTESLQEDDNGYFWIGGVRLIRFDPVTGGLRYYDESDGLQNSSFKIWSSCKLSTGELVFGGINGFSIFDPDNLKENLIPPKVVLNDLLVFDRKIEPGQEYDGRCILEKSLNETELVRLPYDMNSINLSFASLHYVSPSRNGYRYMLEGYDHSWRATRGGRNNATYTNLSPGSYVFSVYGSNCDEVWNDEPKRVTIVITPPFWQTRTAYLFYLLLLLGAVYLFRRSLILKEKRKNAAVVEQMRRQEDERMHQMKLKYFTDISHELKTPLTLIAAPVEELSENPELDSGTLKKLTLVRRNIARLMDLIEQIMDFRRYENKVMNLNLSHENMAAVCKSVMLYFEDQAERRGIEFTFEAGREEITVIIDRDRIEKVLFNIIGNAFKYTENGGAIRVRCSRDGSGAVMEIADNGSGIRPDEIGHVFERFYQGGQSVEGGTGIGLALAKAIVEQHKGRIWVESKQGEGTSFFFTLQGGTSHFSEKELAAVNSGDTLPGPYTTKYEISAKEHEQPVSGGGEMQEGPTVLVVEDSPELRAYLQESLGKHFAVLTAENGRDAYDIALENDVDLVISDIMMPVMDGIELCTAIKGEIRLSHIPVVLLTAKGELEHKIEGFESGADDYIPKPFDMKLLVARVNNLIRQRENLKSVFRKQITIEPSMVTVTPMDEQFLRKCLELIEENMSYSALSVDDLCRGVGLSRPAVYKKIKSLTGMSVVEFIRSIRLKRAAQLLLQDDSSIKNVMYLVGFDNSSYFSSRFKKEFGCTPSEYTRKNRP